MNRHHFIQVYSQLFSTLNNGLKPFDSAHTAQRILYRLFYLAQIQKIITNSFHWPRNCAQLFDTFKGAKDGTIGFSPRQGWLWEISSHDQSWRSMEDAVPKVLFSDEFHGTLTNLSVMRFAQIHEQILEHQKKGESHLRRKTGSYYTALKVARALLDGDFKRMNTSGSICDPACGGGAFLIAATEIWIQNHPNESPIKWLTSMLHGVDINRLSVDICRMNLWLMAADASLPMDSFCRNIRWGNALLCPSIRNEGNINPPKTESANPIIASGIFDWKAAFPTVFKKPLDGFQWVIGNPPWIAHAGRAAQPLANSIRQFYLKRYRAFHGYRTTHGLFSELGAELCDQEIGTLAFILPTSVADLKGYGPTRAAVTHYLHPKEPLTNRGDGVFEGVFQPCMFLYAKPDKHAATAPSEWQLKRDDFSPMDFALLKRLSKYDNFPAKCFGERGLQTSGDLKSKLVKKATRTHSLSLGVGRDVQCFQRLAESCWGNPVDLKRVLKDDKLYSSVDIWIRQTARHPIAAKSPGTPFRNSLLAGYSTPEWHTNVLLGLLNSPILQWFHYQRFRDAREGMPQVKINHLRRYPAPTNAQPLKSLASLAARLSEANVTPDLSDIQKLHALTCSAYEINKGDADRIWAWHQQQ